MSGTESPRRVAPVQCSAYPQCLKELKSSASIYMKRTEKVTESNRPLITLAMIVKDEAHCIERCLESVKDYIDHAVIHDTGSTDGTMQCIEKYLPPIGSKGYVNYVPWQDFGHNRSQVLEEARLGGEDDGYIFMLDADEELVGDKETIQSVFASLTHDTYQMDVHLGDTVFKRNFLFKNAREWEFKDPIHEYAHVEGDFTTGTLKGAHIKSHHDGGRSKDPQKYAKDAALLESIEDRTPRQQFYFAQSQKDAENNLCAMEAYEERLQMGGYEQERFWSAYMLGKLWRSPYWYLDAYEIDPRRAEPLLALGKHYMDKGNFTCAKMFLAEAAAKAIPEDALFVETDVYMWRVVLEYAVCLYYLKEYEDAAWLNEMLIAKVTMPDYALTQAKKNLAFCAAKMNEASHE